MGIDLLLLCRPASNLHIPCILDRSKYAHPCSRHQPPSFSLSQYDFIAVMYQKVCAEHAHLFRTHAQRPYHINMTQHQIHRLYSFINDGDKT